VDVVESCRGFLWLLLGTPNLPSGEGGVLCGGGNLLVEKMNSVDPVFFFQNSRIFLFFIFFEIKLDLGFSIDMWIV
jgi:hypothetical protein